MPVYTKSVTEVYTLVTPAPKIKNLGALKTWFNLLKYVEWHKILLV